VRNPVVARNYADALLAAAEREQAIDQYGDLLDVVAQVIKGDPKIHAVMMSPRVTKAAKSQLLEQALRGMAPPTLAKFLAAVIRRGRQDALTDIAEAYRDRADLHFHRVHASVTTARPADENLRKAIESRIQAVLGQKVLAHYDVEPALLGGVVVRVGDKAFDGSLRRRLQKLRTRMLTAK
jgi:F-type H+-transporting ATPase subunit delta